MQLRRGCLLFPRRMPADSAIISDSVRAPHLPPPGPGGPGRPSPRVHALAAMGVFGAALGAGACTIEAEVGWEIPDTQDVAWIPSKFREQLDLVFVVDDTAGMAAVQTQLGGMWERVRAHLEFAEG